MKKISGMFRVALALMALIGGVNAQADEKTDLLQLKNTTLNLIDALVEQGVLNREQADKLIANAEQKAKQQTQRAEREAVKTPPHVVRVPYVPVFVRDEIKKQVEAGLRKKVVKDVMAQAKQERWGVPDALPDWISRIKFTGDIRLRGEDDLYGSDNELASHLDFQRYNETGNQSSANLNTVEDRARARLRLRLGIDAKVTTNLKTGIRIATGSFNNPVSTNQTLGNFNSPDRLVLDRAYLQYQGQDADGYNWMTLTGGRMPNPWFSTDLIWDKDLNFDGVSATFRHNFGDSLYDLDERDMTLFATLGAFSLQEVKLSSRDKWLFGGQLGFQKVFKDKSSLRVGVAYYNYVNITGKRNTLDSTLRDYTAPEFLQKGNSLFAISNIIGDQTRFGLASDYDIIDVTARYDLARFSPMHWIVTGSYVKNIGYDAGDIRKRTNGLMIVNSTGSQQDPSREKTNGYMLKLAVGWPTTYERHSWQAFMSYRYLERDAVLDAFTDSDFQLGGTNNKGWILGAGYGITDSTWLKFRYLTADEINGPALGIDVLQLDLNARF